MQTITGRFKIETESSTEEVFKYLKEKFSDGFQNYEFKVVDDKQTLRDSFYRKDLFKEEEKKEEEKPTPVNSVQKSLGEEIVDKVNTKTIHADAIVKIQDEPKEEEKPYPRGHCWEGLTPSQVNEGYKRHEEKEKKEKGVVLG